MTAASKSIAIRPDGRSRKRTGAQHACCATIAGPDGKMATVKRRLDILDVERTHDRISEAAYRAGRRLQGAFEQCDRMLGSTWSTGVRVDAALPIQSQIERSVDAAAKVVPMVRSMRERLGRTDAALLRAVLGERFGFAQCASDLRGRRTESEVSYVGRRFRDALEDLATAWGAKGASRTARDDSFAQLAAAHGV